MKALYPEATLSSKAQDHSAESARDKLQAQAVCLEIPVVVETPADASMGARPRFLEETRTVLIFPHGAVVRLTTGAQPGDALVVTNRWTRRRVRCRVVHSKTYPNAKGYAEFEFTGPAAGFWGVQFPAEQPAPAPETAPRPAAAQETDEPASHTAPAPVKPVTPSAEAPAAGAEPPAAPPGDAAADAPGILDELLPVSDSMETAEVEAALASTVITVPGFESAGATPAPREATRPRRGGKRKWILAGTLACASTAVLAATLLYPWSLAEFSESIQPAPAAMLPPPAPPLEQAVLEQAPPDASVPLPSPVASDSQEQARAIDEAPSGPVRAKVPSLRLAPPTAAPRPAVSADPAAAPEVRSELPGPAAGLPGVLPGVSRVGMLPPPKERERVGGDVQPPRLVSSVPPVYPALARLNRVEGAVVVEALIDERGKVGRMQVVSGHPLLHQAALDALVKWEYEPARLNGQPVSMKLSVRVLFRR